MRTGWYSGRMDMSEENRTVLVRAAIAAATGTQDGK